jgi:hypothetical protein
MAGIEGLAIPSTSNKTIRRAKIVPPSPKTGARVVVRSEQTARFIEPMECLPVEEIPEGALDLRTQARWVSPNCWVPA